MNCAFADIIGAYYNSFLNAFFKLYTNVVSLVYSFVWLERWLLRWCNCLKIQWLTDRHTIGSVTCAITSRGEKKNVEPLSFLYPNWILEMLSKLVHDNDLCMGRSAEYALLYKQSNLIWRSNWLPQDTTAHDSNLPQYRIVTTARVIHLLWCDLNALLWRLSLLTFAFTFCISSYYGSLQGKWGDQLEVMVIRYINLIDIPCTLALFQSLQTRQE